MPAVRNFLTRWHKRPNASASVHQIEELYMAAVLRRLASVLLVLLPGSVLFHADV